MNKEEIIRMARDASFCNAGATWMGDDGCLERFAKAVAAAERDKCEKLCQEQIESDALSFIEKYRAGFIKDAICARSNDAT